MTNRIANCSGAYISQPWTQSWTSLTSILFIHVDMLDKITDSINITASNPADHKALKYHSPLVNQFYEFIKAQTCFLGRSYVADPMF